MNKKALIAMSGGVDSSVAAALMKEAGYDCIGVTMKLYRSEDVGVCRTKSCCSLEDVEDARSVAQKLDIPYYVFNFAEDFAASVIGRFVDAYERGETPNPCIDCNRYMKFEKLYHRARELNCDTIVTGHYARVRRDASRGRYVLKKAVDRNKDQSYVLCFMTQEQLSHTHFPLGDFEDKEQVRRTAERYGFLNARKHDSQDICFVQDGDYAGFIETHTGKTYPPGEFVDREGNVLGRHQGIIRYTIGQRKGLGLALPAPLYVCRKDVEKNQVVLCSDRELYTSFLRAGQFNWISVEMPQPGTRLRVSAKPRYRAKEAPATATVREDGKVDLVFDQPQRALTCGQTVALYDGEDVVGGGIIESTARI